jgi:adenosylcobinamide-GDP ribazoletransferase
MKRLIMAFQFLTIIPIRVQGPVSEKELAGSAAFFPVVGAFEGLTAGSVAFLTTRLLPEELAGGLVILSLVVTNGGFHLDGLSDTFDALAIKPSGNGAAGIEKRLFVMKESSIGAIGVTAIVLVILLKVLLLGTLLKNFGDATPFILVFLMPIFSKWTMIPFMYHGTPARRDGLGRIFIDAAVRETLLLPTLFLIIFCATASLCVSPGAHRMNMTVLLLFLAAMHYFVCIVLVRFLKIRFGGLTGDHFGALNEISELLFLMSAALWLRLYTS